MPWVLVSSDTDFIQLIQEYSHVQLYNPIKKEFVEAPVDYDYVTWKSLRGDSSDNIPGIPGIGDKTADKIASDPVALKEFITRPEVSEIFTRNYDLINFSDWSEEERIQMTCSNPNKNWDHVKNVFQEYGFSSITKEESWNKFVETFNSLWS